ncbi:MAG: tellurite resistance TerB family protein, partial [Rhodospirillales bacterium]|nr:tellurite resistance TerB family protein [Rhodospirillales bacterium]
KDVIKVCQNRSLVPDDLHFNRNDGVSFVWAKSAALFTQLTNLKNSTNRKKYEEFSKANNDVQIRINELFDKITPLAKQYFKTKHALSLKGELSEEGKELLKGKKAIFDLNNEIYMTECCHFIARAVLYSEVSEKGRIKKISSLGFGNGNVILGMLTKEQFIVLTFFIALSLLSMAVFETIIKARSQGANLNYFFPAILMTSIYISAVFAALIPKAVWKFENNSNTLERPVAAYLASGFIAVIFGALLSFSLRYLKNALAPLSFDKTLSSGQKLLEGTMVSSWENAQLVFMDLSWSHPYFLQSFVIAITIAFLADTYSRRNSEAPQNARWMDGVLTSILMMIASTITYYWMEGVTIDGQLLIKGTRDAHHQDQWALSLFVLKGAIIGFLIGALVPSWFRANRAITPMEKVRTLLLSSQAQGRVLGECKLINNDEGIESAFNAGTALMVWADGHVDEREIDKLEEFWEKFSYVIGEHFNIESFRNNFYKSLDNIKKKPPSEAMPALDELLILKQNKYLSKLLVLLCTSIMKADGETDKNELKALNSIMETLEITPKELEQTSY